MYTLPYQGAPGGGKRLNYGSRVDVGLPQTKLLLRLTEQLLHVQQMVFVEATFPSTVKHSVLCKNKHVYYVTNCSTEVGEHPILFFCTLWKRAVREQQKPSLVPAESMLEVLHRWCVSEHKHMSNACPSEGCPKSYRPLSISSTNHFVSSTPP